MSSEKSKNEGDITGLRPGLLLQAATHSAPLPDKAHLLGVTMQFLALNINTATKMLFNFDINRSAKTVHQIGAFSFCCTTSDISTAPSS